MPNLGQILSYCCGQPYVDDKKYSDAVKTEHRAEVFQQARQREQLPDYYSSLRSPSTPLPTPATVVRLPLPENLQAFLNTLAQPGKNLTQFLSRLFSRQVPLRQQPEAPPNPFMQPGSRLQVILGALMRNMLVAQEALETDETLEHTRRHNEQVALEDENSLLGQVSGTAGPGMGGGGSRSGG